MRRTSSLQLGREQAGEARSAGGTAEPGRDIDEWLAETLAEEAARLRASADPNRTRTAAPKAGKAGGSAAASKPPVPAGDTEGPASSLGSKPSRTVLHRQGNNALIDRLERIERRIEDSQGGSLSDMLRAIERLEARRAGRTVPAVAETPAPAPAARPQPDFEAALRGFEARIEEISQRVAAQPKPLGRRGLAPADEVARAVQDVRAHQSALASRSESPAEPVRTSSPAAIERLESLSKSQAGVLESIRSEIAGLAGRIESQPAAVDPEPLRAEIDALRASLAAPAPALAGDDAFARLDALSRSHQDALDSMRGELSQLTAYLQSRSPAVDPQALQSEIEALRASLDGAVTRDDLRGLVDAIAGLSGEISDLHRLGGDPTAAAGEIEALQAEIRGIADARAADDGRLVDQIDLLFGKVEAVAATGANPSLIDGFAKRLDDIRELVTDSSAPKALTALGDQLSELQREVALMSLRQVGASEFNELKKVVDGMRSDLATAARPPEPDAALDFDQPEGQAASIESMLASLIGKLDRVEQRMSDPDALDQLQAQVENLAARIGQIPERDPALAALEQSTAELLRQVATWRDGAAALAEQAARSVIAETLPQGADLERCLDDLRAQIDAADERTQEGLATVHVAIDTVARRVSTLEGAPASYAAQPLPLTADSIAPGRALMRRSTDRPAPSVPAEADQPIGSRSGEEVLIEPGAGRPATAPSASPSDRTSLAVEPDAAEVRARLIAAARGAMRAAEADAGDLRKAEPGRGETRAGAVAAKSDGLSGPAELLQRLRDHIERRRRPLLIGAAALVLALAGLQVVRNVAETQSPVIADGGAPEANLAVPPASAPPAGAREGDPTTTQSIGSRQDAPAPDVATPPETPAVAARQSGASPSGELEGGPAAPLARTSAVPAVPVLAAASLATRPVPAPDTAAAAVVPPGLRYAASAGNPVALFDLATRNAEGRGVPRDLKLAASLYEKAAEKGLAPAQYRAGNLYEKGVGVARDLGAARSWYRLAAESGNTRAMHNLAVLVAEPNGGKPDYATAIAWFQKAADHGVRDSQFNLAVLYARGLGTPQDLTKAYHWLAIAATGGDADAGRKRDEVATRLSAPDLAQAKVAVESWRAIPANPAANEVKLPESGWPDAPIKRASR